VAAPKSPPARRHTTTKAVAGLAEQLVNRIVKPLGLVILSRERIQETLDEAVKRGDVTRSGADELAGQLIRRGRQQTEELLADLERLLGRGREQLDTARRKVGVGPTFPISDYDKLTAAQVQQRLRTLQPPDLRKVRTYERRHANRKSVLAAIEKRLG
jgi:polyhydroxyalkanoate synthesis regulator phasin